MSPALARNPPFATDPREGVWIGAGEVFIYHSSDRWNVYPAGAAVNKLAFDGLTLGIATDDGALRFDSGSRRASRLTMSDRGSPTPFRDSAGAPSTRARVHGCARDVPQERRFMASCAVITGVTSSSSE